MMRIAMLALFCLTSWLVSAQPLQQGDIIVTGNVPTFPVGTRSLLVYGSDGSYKWTVASSTSTLFRESLVHNGTLYVGTDTEIKRFDLSGNELPRFNGVDAVNYLAPFADGSIAGANGSGEIFHFEQNGSIRQRLQFSRLVFPANGIDVDRDQCLIRYASDDRIATWNTCTNADPTAFDRAWSAPPQFARAFRVLPDGGFLVALLTDVARLDSSGRIVRNYGIPGRAVALDMNGTSFWTGASGTLVKVSIETGQIEQLVNTGQGIEYLSIVGEPRAALVATTIPALGPLLLILLAACFAVIAVLRMR